MSLRPFLLERYFAKHEFSAPFMLSSSDCESMTLANLLALEPSSEEKLKSLWLGYTDSLGSLELRSQIASLYSAIDPSEVLVHSGAEEVIFNFMHANLKSGDHVIVHFPAYQSLYDVARSIGCEVSLWRADPANGWELDIGVLQSLVRSNTRLVVMNCPHNPTGYIMSPEKQAQMIRVLEKQGILLLSDEVYRLLEYSESDRLPAGCDLYEHAVSVGVMSKSFGLAGLRIGWLATHDKKIYARMAEMKDFTTICNSVPSEFLSALALKHRKKILTTNQNLVTSNLKIFETFLHKYSQSIECVRPKGGALAFAKFKAGIDAEKISEKLVEEKGVMLLPGKHFDFDAHYFRIGLGRQNFAEALGLFDSFLESELAH